MLDDILQLLHQNISHRIWFISDLHNDSRKRCPLIDRAYKIDINPECDHHYLGDAVEVLTWVIWKI